MLDALQAEDIGRERLGLHLGLIDPQVGIAVQFAEADLILPLILRGIRQRTSPNPALGQLADHRPAVVDLSHWHGRSPEDRDTVDKNERKEPDNHT